MEILNSNFLFKEKPLYNTNLTNLEANKNISNLKTAYTSFQETNLSKKLISSYEKYKNQKLLNSAQTNSHKCHKCCPHHFHIHHIHIPQERLYEALNIKKINDTSELMKEVLELKNECRQFREELNKNQREKNSGEIYIKELENQINNNKNVNKKDNNFNIYHNMLDKSFEVLNSVSKKSSNEETKTKGGIYYYKDKNDDYNKLIAAQKNWIDNLPENNNFNPNIKIQNSISPNKTYQINDLIINRNIKTSPLNYNPSEKRSNMNSNTNYEQNLSLSKSLQNQIEFNNTGSDNKNQNRLFFDPKRNNNKGYIIKKGEKINKNSNKSEEYNIKNINKNYNTDPNINNKILLNPSFNLSNPSNVNYNSFADNNNNVDKENSKSNNSKNKDNNNTDNLINNTNPENSNINENKEELKDPLNERYLIVDKNNNPILINGQKLLGIELLPLLDEEGKEVIDENGNIVLIGPNGEPKSQDELEPILLDNNAILVNEQNKPFLGLDGIPLINSEGEPIIGTDELLDNDNKKIDNKIGFVAKDSKGNPIKINIKDYHKDNIDNEKEYNINENDNIRNNSADLKKLKPLLDLEGKPILDSNNNYIILDKNNKPIKNKNIDALLSKDGSSALNEEGNPILITNKENPLNDDEYINELNMVKNKIKNRRKNKNEKNYINYSECNPNSLKKINFIRPDKDPYYDDLEYKSKCFACDVGCSVSKSGYSCMNYSPYNNLIKRRNVTPIKIINGNVKKNKIYSRKEMKKGRRYY